MELWFKNTPDHKVTTFLIKQGCMNLSYIVTQKLWRDVQMLVLQKSIDRFENELQKIANGISKKGGIKKYDKIQQKIGRIKEKYSKVANQFSINALLEIRQKKKSETITWAHDPEQYRKSTWHILYYEPIKRN